ncbi:MAG: TetR/AcrR family transcriptional regulator [Bacteroidota bacterium]
MTNTVETEERIFDAALVVFASKGRDGARMQEIADQAGINKAMLHYYFRSKDRLYEAVFGYVMKRFMQAFAQETRGATTFAEFLRGFIDSYIDALHANPDVFRLMVNENLSGGQALGTHIGRFKQAQEGAPQLFVRKIEAAVERGDIRAVDPWHTILTVISSCIFFFVSRPTVELIHPDAQDWDAFVKARKQHIFDLIYHGLQPAGPHDTPS